MKQRYRDLQVRQARHVWAAVTVQPDATVRELMATTGYCRMAVQRALSWIEAAGYISTARSDAQRLARTRQIVVPFATGGVLRQAQPMRKAA